jgi:phosphatidylinositol alpha-1,6-mannosyltransferase
VVAISRHARDMVELAAGQTGRVTIIPVGVDLPPAHGDARAERPTILTVARLHDRHKGHDVIIRAMPLILERVPEAQWVILGDGRLRPELEQLAATEGLNGRARFLGRVSDHERDAWLDRAHVFAMPSRLPESGIGGEGFGIVYLEAGAHGLPAVAGNVAGAMDAVVDGETGCLVDPTDHVAVADAVSELLLDPARAEALGRAGAARAREFAWPVVAEQIEQLLFEVAGRNPAERPR